MEKFPAPEQPKMSDREVVEKIPDLLDLLMKIKTDHDKGRNYTLNAIAPEIATNLIYSRRIEAATGSRKMPEVIRSYVREVFGWPEKDLDTLEQYFEDQIQMRVEKEIKEAFEAGDLS